MTLSFVIGRKFANMPMRLLKGCWLHVGQQRRHIRRTIACILALQVVTIVAYYYSSTNGKPTSGSPPEQTVGQLSLNQHQFPNLDYRKQRELRDEKRFIALQDDERQYFQPIGSAPLCYVEGTNVEATLAANTTSCQCRDDYFGNECGIPAAVWYRTLRKKYHRWPLKPRKVPRRIIHGFNINHELDFFQVRLEELQDAVDVYIVCESNYTAHGDPKPLHLLDKMRSGFMKPFHSKIIHVPLYKFPAQGHKNGWFVDMYLRTYMGLNGLERITGLRDDDLFVLLDADEIPTRQVLMFLKLYDGYPEPVRLAMRWSVFGFFWKRKQEKDNSLFAWLFDTGKEEHEYEEALLEVTAVSTMEMVWKVCQNNTFLIRKDMTANEDFQERVSQYRSQGHRVSPWTIGNRDFYAGFHCSWCYRPEGIRTKLLSAHVDDKPRWGDYPEKLDLQYISNLIRTGEWFDGSRPLIVADWEKETQYAPDYMLKHAENFSHLLYPQDLSNVVYSSSAHTQTHDSR